MLHGEYDVILVGPTDSKILDRGCAAFHFELSNVGKDADTYTLAADGPVEEVVPAEVSLEAGETEDIRVLVCDRDADGFTLNVISEARGELIAQGRI